MSIFKLLEEKKYLEIIALIKDDESLINATDTDGFSLFQNLVKTKVTDQSQALLLFVATHPKLDLSYDNTEFNLSTIDELVSSVKLDVFQSIISNPQALFNRDKLTYESAKAYLVNIQNTLQRDLKRDPNSATTARTKAREANMIEIIALLRDATILHAIKTDDANLFDRLDKAGASPSDRLGEFGNNKLPNFLLTSANTNLRAWFKNNYEQAKARSSSNPNSFLNNVIQLETQLADLETQCLQAKIAVHQKALDQENDLLGRLVTAMK